MKIEQDDRGRWKWSRCHDKSQLEGSCLLSSSFLYFLCSLAIFTGVALLFAWLTLAPYQYRKLAPFSGVGCQPDNEGSWSIGVYRGPTPFSLQPLEKANVFKDEQLAWPVANPVLTCASVSQHGHASNFVADPFLYIRDGKLYAFFESKNAITSQGDIGVAESSDNGATWEYLGVALNEDWHLSYPYVFDYDGQTYMMPEGSQNGDLRLYRADQFPLKWELVKVIIRRPLVDAAMVEHDGLYWIFASDFQRFGSRKNGELEVWYSSSPLGPWRQHRRNPVHNVGKSSGARNAGRPFVYKGQLYRPGQDCGATYGSKVRLFRVEVLTKDRFREVEVPLELNEPAKGRQAWNGVRQHHLDVQQLPSGEWIALMDGDRVGSGELSLRFYLGCAALLLLLLINVATGVVFGFCRLPSRYLSSLVSRRGYEAASSLSPPWLRPQQLTSKLHRNLARLNRESRSGSSSSLRCSPCARALLLLLLCGIAAAAACAAVWFLFSGGASGEGAYPIRNSYSQFTLLAMSYDARLWNLKMYVRHYSRCASVREIVIVWNRGAAPLPSEFDSAVPVRVRVEAANSLNNRFRPDPLIRTRAVLQLDDDIMLTCDDVERAFHTWRAHPARLVGFYPRLAHGPPLEYGSERAARRRGGYNMVLTGAAFVDRRAFDRYWSTDGAVAAARGVVDELFNCEDILLNFVLANGTHGGGRAVEYLRPTWAVDTSLLSGVGISRNTQSHYDTRAVCLSRFASLFGGVPLRKWEFGARNDGWDR